MGGNIVIDIVTSANEIANEKGNHDYPIENPNH